MPKKLTRKQREELRDWMELHDGCLIYRDEEYTKLESKFYRLKDEVKRLRARQMVK